MPGSTPERKNTPKPKTILFDFDGTIADSVRAGVVEFNRLAEKYGWVQITIENSDELRGKGPRAAMKALSVPMFRIPTVMRGLRRGVHRALPNIKVAEGMRSAIVALVAQGYRLGIVTSNSKKNVEQFLKDNHLEYFDFIQAGARLFGKKSAIKKAVAKNHLEDDAPLFVGDEIRDIEAARKNNMTVVGVTWGLNSRAGLETSEPDFIVDNAKELMDVISGSVN